MLVVQRGRVGATCLRVYNHSVRVHNRGKEADVEELIERLPELTGSQIGRLEDEFRRERQRRASSAGGRQDAAQEGAAPPVTEVLEYRP